MKKIKQINNLIIKYEVVEGFDATAIGGPKVTYTEPKEHYYVFSPKGVCWEDFDNLEDAEEFCRETKDFVRR